MDSLCNRVVLCLLFCVTCTNVLVGGTRCSLVQPCGCTLLLPRKVALFRSCYGTLCLLMVKVHCLIFHQAATAWAPRFEELADRFGSSVNTVTHKKQNQKSSHFGSYHCLSNTSITRQTLAFALYRMLYSLLFTPPACFGADV